jgi:hypothetical protein
MIVPLFIALLIICAVAAIFLRQFEQHLEKLTGPWISD